MTTVRSGRTELSSRERVRLALEHQQTDRIPFAMVCSGVNQPAWADVDALLRRERGIGLQAYLDAQLDIRAVGPPYGGPALAPDEDIWGVRRRAMSYGDGSYDEIDHYPLAHVQDVSELESHRWPDPEWFDYDALPDLIAHTQADGEYCLMASNGNIFESSWYMRGFEQMFMDFVLNPELAHAILGRVTDYWVAFFSRVLQAADGQIDLVFTADDIAGQRGLLMSRGMWEAFLKPYHQRLNKTIHSYGAKVIYHTDGAVMEATPWLVDMGIDVLQALQFSAEGMDPQRLKQDVGDRLCFEGGVSVQTTLPFGTADDVRQEVRHLIDTLGQSGGYILGPSHAIQVGTPPENVLAMFDVVEDYYPFCRAPWDR